MKRSLVLLHGLPGVGKSTLAREFAKCQPDFYYADIARHSDFRSRSMFSLCAELYDSHGQGRSLITEGVLSRAASRDAFVAKLIQHAAEKKTPFEQVVIINLLTDFAVLISRRNRSLADYEKLAADVESGSTRFPYRVLEVATSKSQSVNDDVERLVGIIRRCETSAATF